MHTFMKWSCPLVEARDLIVWTNTCLWLYAAIPTTHYNNWLETWHCVVGYKEEVIHTYMDPSELNDGGSHVVSNHLFFSGVTYLHEPVGITEATGSKGWLSLTGIGSSDGNGKWIHQFPEMRQHNRYLHRKASLQINASESVHKLLTHLRICWDCRSQ